MVDEREDRDGATIEKLYETVRRCLPRRTKDIALVSDHRLEDDLRFDSMGLTVLVFRIDQEFELNLSSDTAALQQLRTLGQLEQLVLNSSLRRRDMGGPRAETTGT